MTDINKDQRLLHMHHFIKEPVNECIFNIKLSYRIVKRNHDREDSSNIDELNN